MDEAVGWSFFCLRCWEVGFLTGCVMRREAGKKTLSSVQESVLESGGEMMVSEVGVVGG